MKKITIGARGSKLSLAYVASVKKSLLKIDKDLEITVKIIEITGDIFQGKKISDIGGKNLFCKEIEESLLKKNIDIAVHALKDMEAVEHKDLVIEAFLKRNDPRDVLISKKVKTINDLNKKIIVGSSSKRREFQLKKINSNISVVHLRGNVDTRINKLMEQKFDAIILAAAGVKCLKLDNEISFFFNTNQLLPAVGQGIIALQCRKDDETILNIVRGVNDREARLCALAERSVLKTIGGNCNTAIGVFAEILEKKLKLKAQLFSDVGDECFDFELSGRDVDAEEIGKIVGKKLLHLAGSKFKN